MSLSILILTFNEESNLPRCLNAVSWCDDVVVLDSFSSDGTETIALAAGARVLKRRFDNFAEQRNYGLDHGQLKYDWVLHLDADEVVTRELREELNVAAKAAKFVAFRVRANMIFRNHQLRHACPGPQVRFGHREHLRFKMCGHGQREDLPSEKVGTLKSSLLHYSFSKGWTDWFEKHNRYSTAEAQENVASQGAAHEWDFRDMFSFNASTRRRAMKELSSNFPGRPVLRFLYMYFFRCGFLDGMAGLQYCLLLVIYEFMILLKADEIRRKMARLPAQEALPRAAVPQTPPVNGIPKTVAPVAHEPSRV